MWISTNSTIQRQGHEWGQSSHPFHSKSIPLHHSWDIRVSKSDLEKGQGHGWGQILRSQSGSDILLTPMPFISYWLAIPFLRYWYLKIECKKSKVKVIVQDHTVGSTSLIDSHLFDSMSISPPISDIWLFQNLTLKIEGQGHGWGQSSRSRNGSNILSTHIPIIPCRPSHSLNTVISKCDLENPRSMSSSHSWPSIQPMHSLFISQ